MNLGTKVLMADRVWRKYRPSRVQNLLGPGGNMFGKGFPTEKNQGERNLIARRVAGRWHRWQAFLRRDMRRKDHGNKKEEKGPERGCKRGKKRRTSRWRKPSAPALLAHRTKGYLLWGTGRGQSNIRKGGDQYQLIDSKRTDRATSFFAGKCLAKPRETVRQN